MPKISELPAGTAPTGAERFPAVQGTATARFTLSQVYAATKTLTNTTYDTAGTGNSFSINGVAATANTGTGSVVRATSPTLVTPALGTPSSVTLTNATGLPIATGVANLGTGIATALAVNVGSAGAPVLFNGAGGTPTSLTLTNGTGLPLSTGITGAGTGVLAALAINVGSAGAPVVFNGAGGTPSSLTLTSATGLPLATGVTGTLPVANAPSIHGADIASATTTNLETATGDIVDVTGTTTITAITLSDGHCRTVRFTGILTLTNGASLVIPGGSNFITAAGDFVTFRGYAAGVVRVVSIQLANAFEEVSSTVTIASPFAISTGGSGVVWNTVAIPRAGLWAVTGNGGISKTGGTTPTYTHLHCDHNITGLTVIQTSPGGGSTQAQHVTSNNENGWINAMPEVWYRTTGATTVNFCGTGDFTGGTCGIYGRGVARRIGY